MFEVCQECPNDMVDDCNDRRSCFNAGTRRRKEELAALNKPNNTITEDEIFAFILNLGDPVAVLERLNTRYENWVSANNECGAQRNA